MKKAVQYLFLLVISLSAVAAEEVHPEVLKSVPHKLIVDVTDELLEKLHSGLNPEKDPDAFYAAIVDDLERLVAFDFIAKGVMGNYAKMATPEQQKAFTEKFKRGLLSAYGKGLANIQNLNIKVLPPEGDITGQQKVAVVQEVRSSNDVTYVSYTMAQSKSGEWKLINVVFNGVNLGKTFRGQFAQAAKQYGGDVDQVIANWDEAIKDGQ